MTVAAVIELSHELRRLAIAGVGLARGDRRVAALVPALERTGESVAVFARIAEQVEALLVAPKDEAPAAFLALNALVGAVVRTQVTSGLEGDLVALPPTSAVPRTIPARALAELHDCLRGGPARVLGEALERGWFGDPRLAPLALEAVRSENPAIADLAVERMIPPYGAALLPALAAALDLGQKRRASRLIEAARRADPVGAAALARQILDPAAERVFDLGTPAGNVSDEAIAAALGCLGDTEADRATLGGFLEATRKVPRVAAARRLLELGDADAEARCLAMLESGGRTRVREALESVPALSGGRLSELVVAHARDLAESLHGGGVGRADVDLAARLLSLLIGSGSAPGRFEAALGLFEHRARLCRTTSEPGAGTLVGLDDVLDYLIDTCPPERRADLARLETLRAGRLESEPGRSAT